MDGELVGCGTQGGVAGRGAVLRAVNLRLEVLDANAHSKGFALELDTTFLKQLIDVSRGMTTGEHQL